MRVGATAVGGGVGVAAALTGLPGLLLVGGMVKLGAEDAARTARQYC